MARAAVLHAVGDKTLDLRDDITPIDPGPDDVRVRIRATGVCHSDLSVMTGVLPATLPAVLGHEGAGEVVAVGDRVTGIRPGDHVVINWTPNCGVCGYCDSGRPYLCTVFVGRAFRDAKFRQGDADPGVYAMAGCGTFAEEITVPRLGVIKIADDVPFEYAALLGCGLPTGLGAVFNTAALRPGATVAVVGAGGVGLSVIQGARIAGASTILAVDPNTAKHPTALDFGATHTATLDDLADVKAELAPRGFDHVFEVVGRAAAIETAYGLAGRGGEVIVVGVAPGSEKVTLNPFQLVFDGKTVKGSLYGECDLVRDVPRFVNLWRAGRLDIERLITRRIRFEELNDAIATLERGEAIRQVVLFD
ncbi:Zn-dependent alcohol dehydrogenase [Thermomonospora cellulosilytica]|uniref:S-(Hydroxymethyl)glutathione dehydrogenase/alcohol dehydrogenase n=1 Tax=Thermomonospora cellulosilytica TaxID=1411118 RepID=A0A7W3N4R2_9ACTN|nr:Zn-dependent alcohol dehydrogenase [Thermomonospora cellulosilytica]MBA9007428.1 S-(hydroxymethyl)glutathione dehydrogenase/alcohol dehydrogenase [Thermomonospora cellulosilytica]